MPAYIKINKTHYCKKCDKPIKRLAQLDSHLEKWICPTHGKIKRAYIETDYIKTDYIRKLLKKLLTKL